MRGGANWRSAVVLGVAVVAFACLFLLLLAPTGYRTDAAPPEPGSPGEPDLAAHYGTPPDLEPERIGALLVARTEGEPFLAGCLLTAEDEPVPGAWVKIVPVSTEPGFAQCVITDGGGEFDFGRIPPHRYRVVVEGGGGYVIGLVAGELSLESGGAYIDIHLPDTLLTGRIHTGGTLIEGLHDPSRIQVDLLSGGRLAARGRAERDLTFHLHGVEPGRYRLVAGGFCFRGSEQDVTVSGTRTKVDLSLEPIPPTEVCVRVLAAEGEPVTSGGVTLTRRGWFGTVWLSGDPLEPGVFVNDTVLPGEWRLRVRAAGFHPMSETIEIAEGRCSTHEVRLKARQPRGR